MAFFDNIVADDKTNFILIGEAGCGKSEISLNLALKLRDLTKKPVHFFDLDMTKPLFRSRDVFDSPQFEGIIFHYEQQFFDAPTQVGGVRELLNDPESIVVLDVGGDDIGARAIGGYMLGPGRAHSKIFYIVNAFRPFCQDIEHIDQILGEILAVSHIDLSELVFIDNPNIGGDTQIEDVISGSKRMREILSPYQKIELTCVHKRLEGEIEGKLEGEYFAIDTYLSYPWA